MFMEWVYGVVKLRGSTTLKLGVNYKHVCVASSRGGEMTHEELDNVVSDERLCERFQNRGSKVRWVAVQECHFWHKANPRRTFPLLLV